MNNISPEQVGQIIDIFDDFLEKRDIRIPSSDMEMIQNDEVLEEEIDDYRARIYGHDYDELAAAINKNLSSWK